MTDVTSPALQAALAYYQAWTRHDLDQAMSYVAADIICDTPAGRLEGADAYRDFLGPFVQITTGAKMLAAFGDDETALVMYDTQTVPVKSAPGAECVTVKDGGAQRCRIGHVATDRLSAGCRGRLGPGVGPGHGAYLVTGGHQCRDQPPSVNWHRTSAGSPHRTAPCRSR